MVLNHFIKKKMKNQKKIGVIDLCSNKSNKGLWARYMYPNYASIMPQVVSAWCQEEGHLVEYVTYTGSENLKKILPKDVDIVFINSYTEGALLAYALSNYFRHHGAITALGGPHAKSYPLDAVKYFDYVFGFTNREMIEDVLKDGGRQRPIGIHLSASKQPAQLPGVVERWPFIEKNLAKARFFKAVPMIGSVGCPYSCSFCVDSTVPYQPLDYEALKEDLRFVSKKMKRPIVGWHDPNFGVRFEDYIGLIEEAVPKGSMRFAAESSLSLLTEKNLKRMNQNGFVGILPGIESWFEMGNKSKSQRKAGKEKLFQVAAHVNMIMEYIPYVQTNFVLGLDSDSGEEPWELSKEYIDLVPGAFPVYALMTSFGRSAPLNLQYQKDGRIIPLPFHFLNTFNAFNVRPMNYSWEAFYKKTIDLISYGFSRKVIWNRVLNSKSRTAKTVNLIRSVSRAGPVRVKYLKSVLQQFKNPDFRKFFAGESTIIPAFYHHQIQKDLADFYDWLPDGAIYHAPNAWLNEKEREGVFQKS